MCIDNEVLIGGCARPRFGTITLAAATLFHLCSLDWNYLWPALGVAFGRTKDRRIRSIDGSGCAFFFISGRARRFLRRCSVGVALGDGVATTGIIGAAVKSGVSVVVAVTVGVTIGNSIGVDAATGSVSLVAG